MVPKIHAKGCSFKGIAKYILHDKDRAETSDRVAWSATRSLASDDPNLAWKLMAATAMDADRLKAQAGVKNTGRKSKDAVLHVTLSWHPDESSGLAPKEMLRAADGAIKALGAQDRQAMIVAHSDEEQAHIHIIINRVSPEDGRMLPSSKDRLRLSKWAQTYEEERGKVLCEERIINNAARTRGEYVRGERDTPRHIYEQIRANDNTLTNSQIKAFWREHRGKDRAVGKRQRAMRDAQAAAWAKLAHEHKERRAGIFESRRLGIVTARRRVRDGYRNAWKELHQEQRAEIGAFTKNEESMLGRIRNRARSIDVKAILRGEKKGRAIGEAFDAIGSAGARLEQLKKSHTRSERALAAEQKAREAKAAMEVRQKTSDQLVRARGQYQTQRAGLVFTQSMEQAKVRADWKTRAKQRRTDYARQDITPERKNMLDRIRDHHNNKDHGASRDRDDDRGR